MGDNNGVSAILELNEELKLLNRKTEQISMIALNAMLSARNSGVAPAAFTVVTTELRSYCTRLRENAELLSHYIFRMVFSLSQQRKHATKHRIFQRVSDLTAACGEEKENCPVLRRINDENIRLLEVSQGIKHSLLLTLTRAIKQSEVGETLGVLAKVEAQYGRADHSLTLIAKQVSEMVDEIQLTLKRALSELK